MTRWSGARSGTSPAETASVETGFRWVEAQDGIVRLELLEAQTQARIRHVLCPACEKTIRTTIPGSA